jgi:hypothetical protein
MNAPELKSRLLQRFPVFLQLPDAAVGEIVRAAAPRHGREAPRLSGRVEARLVRGAPS